MNVRIVSVRGREGGEQDDLMLVANQDTIGTRSVISPRFSHLSQ